MSEPDKRWYNLIKHNFQNPDPATTRTLGTVLGLANAQIKVEALSKRLTPEETAVGFDVYCEECDPAPVVKKHRKSSDARRERR
ncbi:hypothetical protein SBA3_3140029 [Candidatus Sulfopaludibacter sp. SbA3]|nr:hypothetical protein SBA3_3140029 [Candidatus Sulfopaludibacter sp. SbA3]